MDAKGFTVGAVAGLTGDPAVMDLAEEHRQHTDRWYHDCGHEIHRQYAQAYLANDDDMPPGLAQYRHDAIIANCQRAADGQDHPATPALKTDCQPDVRPREKEETSRP
jgi:hypothetical protein